jgi:phosphatidylinositol dimannoside acyltransferase
MQQYGGSFRDRIAAFQYGAMERVATTWPPRIAKRMFRLYGRVGFEYLGSMRETVAANLGHVLGRPPESEIVRAATLEAFDLYARYWYDSFRARVMTPKEVNERFVIENIGAIDRALERGRGVLIGLPHLGNWDVGGRFLAGSGYKICAVAERLANTRVFQQFLRHREELGLKIVALDPEGDTRVGPQLMELLSDNWVITLLADRDLTGRGVDVEMFGATRQIPAGPALLSLSSGAPLLGASIYTTDTGWLCRISEPLEIERSGEMRSDVRALSKMLAAEFERSIAAKPTDWHMFQPAWPDAATPVAEPSLLTQ